jgi:hypothetical protein
MYKVNLTYFKTSGKYYSEGEYNSVLEELYEIWYEVLTMSNDGILPGLVKAKRNPREFYILIDVPDHPDRHLHLIPIVIN